MSTEYSTKAVISANIMGYVNTKQILLVSGQIKIRSRSRARKRTSQTRVKSRVSERMRGRENERATESMIKNERQD